MSTNDFSGTSSDRFREAVEFLESRTNLEKSRTFSLKDMEKRLDDLRRYLKIAGGPEKKYRTVHVAGTKGKGSTCAMLEAILMQEGHRVGRFTSPHLYSFLERFTIDGVPCDEEEFVEILELIRSRLEKELPELVAEITYFELTTLVAFEYFARQQVDFAIFEVGMGGRWDATNLCRPELTIITSISFDHIEQLGPTLAEIAAEKGGIIKPGIPVLSTVRRTEAQDVLRKTARLQKAPAFFLGEAFFLHPSREPGAPEGAFRLQTASQKFPVNVKIEPLTVSLPGSHQIRNASLAVAATILLHQKTGSKVDPNKIARGLQRTTVPARIEIFPRSETLPTFIVDGAHNRSSIRALIKTVREKFPESRLLLLFGVSMGKDVEGMLADIVLHFEYLFLTQHSSHPRRFPPQGLKTILSSIPDAPRELREEFCLSDKPSDFLNAEDSVHLDLDVQVPLWTGRHEDLETTSQSPLIRVEAVEDSYEALEKCLVMAAATDVVCVTGSMFLAAELRQYFLERKDKVPESR